MERLTEKISNGTRPKTLRGLIRWFVTHNGIRKDVIIGEYNKLYDRLAEYEDLGFTPEQIRGIENALCKLIEMQPTTCNWHKVADGDLPPEPKSEDDVKRYLTAQKSIRGPYYINDITKYYGNLPCAELNLWWWQEHCVAWMELPEYKEEQDKQ